MWTFFTTCSELQKVVFLVQSVCGFLFVYEISRPTAKRICTEFTQKTCYVPRLDMFEGQGHREQKSIFGPFSGLRVVYIWENIFSL